MLVLESARVKLEADWDEPAVEPPSLYAERDDKQELTSTPELPRPAGLPTIKTEQPVKHECSDECDCGSDSNYASSECSGEFLAEEPLATGKNEQFKQCIVRIKTDPVIELMCNVYRKKQKTFACDCGALFKLEGYLKRHLKKCTKVEKKERYKENEDKDNFVCTICHARYTEKENFDRHLQYCLYQMKRRYEAKLFICDICSKRYTDRYPFMVHVKKCSEQGQDSLAIPKKLPKKLPYQCKYCPKRFLTPSALLIHDRMHSGARPFKCEVCGKDFNQDSSFIRHKVTHKFHSEKKYRICDYCGKHFAYKTDIIRHIMQIHMKVMPRSCPVCGKRTASNHMNRHMLTHFPEKAKKTYPCDVCKKVFLERSNLRVHMRVHTGNKPYSCKVCSTKFSYLTSLVRHEAIHTHIRSFRCRVCKKHFEFEKKFIYHARLHIWDPDRDRSVKKRAVARLDCSVRLERLPR